MPEFSPYPGYRIQLIEPASKPGWWRVTMRHVGLGDVQTWLMHANQANGAKS